jgi:hypothetical protein
MWNSSPGRISCLAVLSSQGSHGVTRLARGVEPWAEDDAREAGVSQTVSESATSARSLKCNPFVARVASSVVVAASSRALSTLVPTPQTYGK